MFCIFGPQLNIKIIKKYDSNGPLFTSTTKLYLSHKTGVSIFHTFAQLKSDIGHKLNDWCKFVTIASTITSGLHSNHLSMKNGQF